MILSRAWGRILSKVDISKKTSPETDVKLALQTECILQLKNEEDIPAEGTEGTKIQKLEAASAWVRNG